MQKKIFIIVLLISTYFAIPKAFAQPKEGAEPYLFKNNTLIGKDLTKFSLNVSNTDGSSRLSYPLNSQVINGHNLDVTLNYSSSVNFTSFAPSVNNPLDPTKDIDYSYDDHFKWDQFNHRKPAWIIGVNGFAVQVLAFTSMPFNSPMLQDARYYYDIKNGNYPLKAKEIQFKNSDMIWSINGYNYCNTLGAATPNEFDIHILRVDGSILELTPSNGGSYYYGEYRETGPDANGIAIVEPYDYSYERAADPNFEANKDSLLFGITSARLVRYYPGDGMCYEFKEDVNPYGSWKSFLNLEYKQISNLARHPVEGIGFYNNEKTEYKPLSFYGPNYIKQLCTGGTHDLEIPVLNIGFATEPHHPFQITTENSNQYSGSIDSKFRSKGDMRALPTIFYLTAVYNQDRKIANLEYIENNVGNYSVQSQDPGDAYFIRTGRKNIYKILNDVFYIDKNFNTRVLNEKKSIKIQTVPDGYIDYHGTMASNPKYRTDYGLGADWWEMDNTTGKYKISNRGLGLLDTYFKNIFEYKKKQINLFSLSAEARGQAYRAYAKQNLTVSEDIEYNSPSSGHNEIFLSGGYFYSFISQVYKIEEFDGALKVLQKDEKYEDDVAVDSRITTFDYEDYNTNLKPEGTHPEENPVFPATIYGMNAFKCDNGTNVIPKIKGLTMTDKRLVSVKSDLNDYNLAYYVYDPDPVNASVSIPNSQSPAQNAMVMGVSNVMNNKVSTFTISEHNNPLNITTENKYEYILQLTGSAFHTLTKVTTSTPNSNFNKQTEIHYRDYFGLRPVKTIEIGARYTTTEENDYEIIYSPNLLNQYIVPKVTTTQVTNSSGTVSNFLKKEYINEFLPIPKTSAGIMASQNVGTNVCFKLLNDFYYQNKRTTKIFKGDNSSTSPTWKSLPEYSQIEEFTTIPIDMVLNNSSAPFYMWDYLTTTMNYNGENANNDNRQKYDQTLDMARYCGALTGYNFNNSIGYSYATKVNFHERKMINPVIGIITSSSIVDNNGNILSGKIFEYDFSPFIVSTIGGNTYTMRNLAMDKPKKIIVVGEGPGSVSSLTLPRYCESTIDYSVGDFTGGLPFKVTNANNATIANYYSYNNDVYNVYVDPSQNVSMFNYSVADYFNNGLVAPNTPFNHSNGGQYYLPAGYIYDNNYIEETDPSNLDYASSRHRYVHNILETPNLFARSKPVAVRNFVRKGYDFNIQNNNAISILPSTYNKDKGSAPSPFWNKPADISLFNFSTFFEYDEDNNLTATIDPNNNMSVFSYDNYGRILQTNLPYDYVDNSMGANVSSYDVYKYSSILVESAICVENPLFNNENLLKITGYDPKAFQVKEIPWPICNFSYSLSDDSYNTFIVSRFEGDNLASYCQFYPKEIQEQAYSGHTINTIRFKRPDCLASADPQATMSIAVRFDFAGVYDDASKLQEDEAVDIEYYFATGSETSSTGYGPVPSIILNKSSAPIPLKFYANNESANIHTEELPVPSEIVQEFLKDLPPGSPLPDLYLIIVPKTVDSKVVVNTLDNAPVYKINGGLKFGVNQGFRHNYTINNSPDLKQFTTKCRYDYDESNSNPAFGKYSKTFVKIDDASHRYEIGLTSSDPMRYFGYFNEYIAGKLLKKTNRIAYGEASSVEVANNQYIGTYLTSSNIIGTGDIVMRGSGGGVLPYIKDEWRQSSFNYSSTGDLTTRTSPYEERLPSAPTNYSYDYVVVVGGELLFKKTIEIPSIVPLKKEEYYDCLGKLIKSVELGKTEGDPSHLTTDKQYMNGDPINDKEIVYIYNDKNQLIKMINPAGQTFYYWYDVFGRRKYVASPYTGITSYAYDNVGNVRYTQTEKQALSGAVTFYQYDDLNRLTATGVAELGLNPHTISNPCNNAGYNYDPTLNLNRYTDLLDPKYLHTNSGNTLLTINQTIWRDGADVVPASINVADGYKREYPDSYMPYPLRSSSASQPGTVLDYIMTNQFVYDSKTSSKNGFVIYHWLPPVTANFSLLRLDTTNFENANYPLNKIVNQYDEMPPKQGSIWGKAPDIGVLERMAPGFDGVRKFRNLKGKLAATAYRDTTSDAYNFIFYSYDARGRVEAEVKVDNYIGISAVYYQYNSMDEVIATETLDAFHRIVTWNEFDNLGRKSGLVSYMDENMGHDGVKFDNKNGDKLPLGYDLGFSKSARGFAPYLGSDRYDIKYNYYQNDQLKSIEYPQIVKPDMPNKMTYRYYFNGALESILSNDQTYPAGYIYGETFNYNDRGLISQYKTYLKATTLQNPAEYKYDSFGQIYATSTNGFNSMTRYSFDKIGNVKYYDDGGGSTGNYEYNTNLSLYKALGAKIYSYDANGNTNTTPLRFINQNYNYRDLLSTDLDMNPAGLLSFGMGGTEWQTLRYRYTPGDEREIKTALNAFEYTLTNSAKAPLASYCGQIKTISSPPWTFNNNDLYDVILENHDRSMENCNVYGGYLEDYYQKLGSGNLNTLLMATPNEYNVFGNSATPIITYKLVANRTFNSITMSYNNQNNATWEKQYNFLNYQGSIIGKQSANAWNNPVLKYATYYPFAPGLSASDMDSKLSWLGKEKDRYSQHTILGVRTYNDETRRFEQVDRLWEKYPGWTPYHYCGNDLVNKVDVTGLLPGDPFVSKEQAAHDFGKNYNALSFALNMEISTTIYEYENEDGEKCYTYAIPNTFAENGANPTYSTISEKGYTRVAEAHTHGPFIKGKTWAYFSDEDKKDKTVIQFMITPNGELKSFNPKNGRIRTLTKDLPADTFGYDTWRWKYYWQIVDSNPDKRPLPIIGDNGTYMVKFDDAKVNIMRKPWW